MVNGGLVWHFGISWSYSLADWSEWESDLRPSTSQARTLSTRQQRFSYLVVFCVSSSWLMVDWSGILVFPGHTHSLFWSAWESDLRPSTSQARTLSTRQQRFSYLVVFCVSSSWLMVDWSGILVFPGHTH